MVFFNFENFELTKYTRNLNATQCNHNWFVVKSPLPK